MSAMRRGWCNCSWRRGSLLGYRANIGYFSLAAAATLRNTGQVSAFEPGRVAYARLTANVALNPFANLKTFRLAVAAAPGEVVLFTSGEIADSGANIFQAGAAQTTQERVRVVALDQLLQEEGLQEPNLIKIDVEGAELAVLQGAAALLTRARPMLLMEMEEKNLQAAGTSRAAIAGIAGRLGLPGCLLHKGKWHRLEDVTRAKGRNVFWFVPSLPTHQPKAALLHLCPGA